VQAQAACLPTRSRWGKTIEGKTIEGKTIEGKTMKGMWGIHIDHATESRPIRPHEEICRAPAAFFGAASR